MIAVCNAINDILRTFHAALIKSDSYIQCGMFKEKTHAVFVDKREYGGPLWKQVDNAFQFVLRNIHLVAKLEGIFRKDIYELPPDSIREPIINAVMNAVICKIPIFR